ncbi:MAG: hypothetical protein LAP13_06600 [Acidobacteriia bacterium]|nr:hypothetical protein [Terriglobia bacterium]
MNRTFTLLLALLLGVGMSFGATKSASKTFVGEISDSMCGLKHMMPGGAKACTDECVKAGAKYVLADQAAKKVYGLSDQEKPKQFSGGKVKVTGTLSGDTIQVTSITAAQ